MQIDLLTLIEDALVGGRSGDMSFIYNNPLIFELFLQWKNKKENLKLYQGNDAKAFKGFLNECLKEDKNEPHYKLPAGKKFTRSGKENLRPKPDIEHKTHDTKLCQHGDIAVTHIHRVLTGQSP